MQQQKKISVLSKVVIVIIIVAISLSSYCLWKKYSLKHNNKTLGAAIGEELQEINSISKDRSINKKSIEILKAAKDYRITWSKILNEVLRQEDSNITFSSFSSGREKKISVNGEASNWEVVSLLIEKLKSNPRIQSPFVHSISKSSSEDSRRTKLSFTLTFNYTEKE